MKTRENKVKISKENNISSSTAPVTDSSFETDTDSETVTRSHADDETPRNTSETNIRSRRTSCRTKRTPKPELTALQPLSPDVSSTEIATTVQPIDSPNGLLWVGIEGVFDNSSILESRLREVKEPVKTKVTRTTRTNRHIHTEIAPNSTNNNSHNHVNNNLLKDEPVFRKLIAEEPCRKRSQDSDEMFFFRMDTSFDGEALHLQESEISASRKVTSTTNGTSSMKFNHRPERREKKAKVKLKDEEVNGSETVVEMKNLGEESCIIKGEDKKRKKDDKNRKKKLRHLEEENLSKRIYESRELRINDAHATVPEILSTTEVVPLLATDDAYTTDLANPRLDDDRKGGILRLKTCGECGARHAGGVCPFSRPTQRIPDKCHPPIMEIPGHHHPQNGVIVAPPHREKPANLTNESQDDMFIEETWRSPQRPGSPGCYCRNSLPSGLALEMRPIVHPPESNADDSDDAGMIGINSTKPKEIETVVSRVVISRYTQLGPVVGVAVKEKDIPDDFCMVNLWEVFGGENKRYISTVDPNKSNWTRYLRPAPDRESANLILVPRQLHDSGNEGIIPGLSVESIGGISVFLVSTQEITAGDELMFWAHDPTLAWSRKKMEKTNCGGCNMRFSHPLYYRMHCSVFHDPNYSLTIRKYHCKVCGLAVLGKENIMRHAAEQHEGKGAYQCQFCKKFFLRLHSLDMHVTYSCGRNPARVFPLCDYCGKKFCQPQHLRSHQKRMHADMAEVLREFQCKLCFKILGSRAALQRHLKEVHHKDLSSGATCDRCGKMFQNKSNLKIHMLTHSGVKPFRCVETGCNAAFTTKQCLQFHYKKVHGYSVDSIPQIERCIPYTFNSYSGGLVADPETGKLTMGPRSPSTEASMETPLGQSETLSSATDTESNSGLPLRSRSQSPELSPDILLNTKLPPATTLHGYLAKYTAATRMVSKGSRKWLGDSCDGTEKDQEIDEETPPISRDIYTFEDRLDEEGYKKKEILETKDEEKPFRRESNASLLVEAALNVAENSMKSETRMIGAHDRLLSYAGAVNSGTSLSKYSSTISIANAEDHLLPHETAISTHIKYSESGDEERSHLEYTLEREYDPRDLPEVVVVHESVNTRDLSDSLTNDFHDHLHSALENLQTSEENIQEIHDVHDLALSKTECQSVTPQTPSDSHVSISSSGIVESTLHVLDHLPVTQGLPVNLPTSLGVGLDMTYKHYRIASESALSHEHLLAATPMDESECGIGLETMENAATLDNHELSPRSNNLSEQIPLPELQPHDFRGLHTLRSPSRSPYLSPSHTPEETLRSYLISTDGLRSPHSSDQGLDMSRNNVFIRTSELPTIAYRYQNEVGSSGRGQIYEIDRSLSHTVDLSLVGRGVSYAELSRTINPELYASENRIGSSTPTLYITNDRDELRQSLDLTIPRSSENESQNDSSLPINMSSSPHASQPNISHTDALSPTTQLIAYTQISPSTHANLSPIHATKMERTEVRSPIMDTTHDSIDSSSPEPSVSLPAGTPLPPISRIVSASPHTFYTARQIIPASRQDITLALPTHVYTESYVVSNGVLVEQPPPTSPCSADKDRPSSPSYLQYPSSPYDRYHQEPSSPPSGFHYQYY